MMILEENMKIKDIAGWEAGLANNRDPYGSAVYRYAENWANIMEKKFQTEKGCRILPRQHLTKRIQRVLPDLCMGAL